ncbi:hypothetical protein FCV87_18220 [Vibrio breoganii]|uniref:hypothetical protein n=1 Tax=Vibrio breoganii TaxID=553239 RepID=UPI0010BDD6DA|nr:hypothetical protein [Vibrio breoganii]TKG24511.1 hypothetical protein FCV87_18220 [Vibrio breoganii]
MKRSDVQFYGLPAVGKTTLVNLLLKRHPDMFRLGVYHVNTPRQLLGFPFVTIKSILNLHFIFFTFLTLFFSLKSKVGFKFTLGTILGCLFNIVSYNIDLRCRGECNKVTLWDEMISQRTFSVLGYSLVPPGKIITRALNYNSMKFMRSIYLYTSEDYQVRLNDRGLTDRMKKFCNKDLCKVIKSHLILDSYLKQIGSFTISCDNRIPVDDIVKFVSDS